MSLAGRRQSYTLKPRLIPSNSQFGAPILSGKPLKNLS